MDIISLWSKIFGSRKLHCVPILQREDCLHNSFSKGFRSDQSAILIIFDRTCQNLGRTGALPIDQYRKRVVQIHIPAGSVILTVSIFIFCIHNCSLRQNIIQDLDNCGHHTTGIVSHIDDQCFHSLILKIFYCLLKLCCRLCLKGINMYISDTILEHLVGHTWQCNVLSFYIKGKIFLGRRTVNLQMDSRSLLSTNQFYQFRKFHGNSLCSVHGNDHVIFQQSC